MGRSVPILKSIQLEVEPIAFGLRTAVQMFVDHEFLGGIDVVAHTVNDDCPVIADGIVLAGNGDALGLTGRRDRIRFATDDDDVVVVAVFSDGIIRAVDRDMLIAARARHGIGLLFKADDVIVVAILRDVVRRAIDDDDVIIVAVFGDGIELAIHRDGLIVYVVFFGHARRGIRDADYFFALLVRRDRIAVVVVGHNLAVGG